MEKVEKEGKISAAIRAMCTKSFGVLDSSFLCQSLSVLCPPNPICVNEDDTLRSVISLLKTKSIGCVLVVGKQGKLVGIFSERDCMLKVLGEALDLDNTKVSQVMTKNPVSETPDTTTAYALNLMSQGGFRHLPLVDQDGVPIGIVSVKNIVDFIVETMTKDLLDFEVGG